jgi:molybdate transport system ATP-binding protein
LARTHLAHHELAVNGRLGALHLDFQADFTAPWTILFGPSGSGKSSLLRCMARLPLGQATSPRIVFERHNPDGTWTALTGLPTHRRNLAYAPQNPSLFPHLTVQANVRFPYQVCAIPPQDATLVDEALTLFSLHALVDRLPRELSGGERQRVSLARAFATPSARLILLDEPFTGLDRPTRDNILPRMQQWLTERKIPAISVTHDVDEALQLHAEVLRLDSGHLLAQGPATVVLAEERQRLLNALG